jgi:hypothetical protein
MTEDLTPIECERKLRTLVTAMSQAQTELRNARDKEVARKHEYEAAKRRAFLSAECPRPSRGGNTVADREVYVDNACADEQMAYDIAVVRREDAHDHVRTVDKQAMAVMALLRSTTTAYNLSGSSQHEGV